jgi:3-dehydroquinate synthase
MFDLGTTTRVPDKSDIHASVTTEIQGETALDTISTVSVDLGARSYEIVIGSGILAESSSLIRSVVDLTHAIVITDENVEEPHATALAENVVDDGVRIDLIIIEPGETSKSVGVADRLWQQLLDLEADRKTVVIAAGGGVIGDLAGFVAATYARGLTFVQVPTTLLAQVDSSVGGKVGVNLPTAKNMVGAFWQPSLVLIDTQVLKTLAEREYRAGLGEVVKYGVILDSEFFEYLEQNVEGLLARDDDVLRHVVSRCCRLKADVVENDEREESGLRAILNYGHTFGHALEAVTGYEQLLHGEGVAIGMICASRLAERLGRIDPSITTRQHNLLTALGLPVDVPDVDQEAVVEAMQRDKKVAHGKLRFVLPTRIGHVELVGDVSPADILAAIS